jgi:trehalose 6-phosphate synthase/phosphatase
MSTTERPTSTSLGRRHDDLQPSSHLVDATGLMRDRRLVVVSNRLPLTLRRTKDGSWRAERSTGGLVTALGPVLKKTGGLWIGWPGEPPETPDDARQSLLERWEERHGYVTVDLSRATSQRFYHGYANSTLWPLFHGFPSHMEFGPEGWDAYLEANTRFRDAVLDRLRPGDLVWVHDYHLMLLPQLIRDAAPDVDLGFFLHIPFPYSDVFGVLPRREELLRGLLGADCIAFHTHGHLQNFRSSLLRFLGIGSRMDGADVDGRFARFEALPIGIVADEFTGLLDGDPAVGASLDELHKRYAGLRILLGVDRLDYTKGIPERLRSYRRLLERAPHLRGKVVLVQVAVPSRERIARYKELRSEVNELVGGINGDFGTPDWTPVVYIRRSIARPDLVALYALADVGWITPLRDGMNLVAKEYVACQRGRGGALVLSEFAGAAAEMGEAFIVNPYDEDHTAAVVERVLGLPAEERRERMAALYTRVVRNSAMAWSVRFVTSLRDAARSRSESRSGEPKPLPLEGAVGAFEGARRRLLLLDYDGTLVPFASRPREAVPPAEVVSLLGRLASNPAQRVAIVSGRPRTKLEPWLGQVRGLWLAAEHGAILRSPASGRWEPLRPNAPLEWKARVQPVLEHFVDRTPGSFIEEKEYSLVWHHRMSDPEFGEWLANELVATLDGLLADTELRAVRGRKSIEVRLIGANKSEVLSRIGTGFPDPDFILAAGDDWTDEDLFQRLPAEAWTIHIGEGLSVARYRLGSPAALQHLLERFAAADSGDDSAPQP